ncbi:phosphotransferase family enzyme [Lacrimispora xylanisolvens]|uniref:Phosphotransferase family enzyme n=1 Tax=Lacrimispora xylanisolvens TaxID=384636 RepID=A0A2S6HRA1_9FIRM|nr:phosphotransferase [Hungatella xylanolytica]PPK80024.1 phosphotransferase family enzyme [Hungatella xylanolytica]
METDKVEQFMKLKTKVVFGDSFILNRMTRILGGAQKHTYLAETKSGFCFIIYIWDKSTSYFTYNEEKDIFSSSSSMLFELNNNLMLQHNVLTPKLYFMDRSKEEQDYEYAFAEYIDGTDMDHIISQQEDRLPGVLSSLKTSINNLHKIKSDLVGQLNRMQTKEFDVLEYSLKAAQKNIEYLKAADGSNKKLHMGVWDKLLKLSSVMVKRQEYTFIHGELGPNHVMVDNYDNAYLIDIEGGKYCDLEEELSFLNIRFGRLLQNLEMDLDSDRMEFYHIGHCLNNLSGAIQLKLKDYYDMDDVNGMIHYFNGLLKEVVGQQAVD